MQPNIKTTPFAGAHTLAVASVRPWRRPLVRSAGTRRALLRQPFWDRHRKGGRALGRGHSVLPLAAGFSGLALRRRAPSKEGSIVIHPKWRWRRPEMDPYQVVHRILPWIVGHMVSCATIIALHRVGLPLGMPFLVHPLLGGVLGLLMAFRTNSAYERHWSVCRLLSEMQHIMMNMARLASHLSRTDFMLYRAIMRYLSAFPMAVKSRLNRDADRVQLKADVQEVLLPEEVADMDAADPILAVLANLSTLLQPIKARDDGYGKNLALWGRLEDSVGRLQAVATQLELVLRTRLPRSYSVHVNRFVFLWVCTLPCVLVELMRPLSVLATMFFVTWALYSTEELALIMEEPFGRGSKPATVPVGSFCHRSKVDLRSLVQVEWMIERRVDEGSWVVKAQDLVHFSPEAGNPEAEGEGDEITDI